AGQVGVEARLVVEDPDLDDAVGNLGAGRARGQGQNADECDDACDGHALRSFATDVGRPPALYPEVVMELVHVGVELSVRNHVHHPAVLHHVVTVGDG